MSFSKLPKEYKAQCLTRWNETLDKDFLNSLEIDCPGAVEQFFAMTVVVSGNDIIPDMMRVKSVCIRALDGRYQQCGSSLSDEIIIFTDEHGKINWWQYGPYEFIFDSEGWATEIVQGSSKARVKVDVFARFNLDFDIVNGWSDKHAAGKRGMVKYSILDYFGDMEEGNGPATLILDKTSSDLVDLSTKHTKANDAQTALLQKHQLECDTSFLSNAKQERKRRASGVARAHLTSKRAYACSTSSFA